MKILARSLLAIAAFTLAFMANGLESGATVPASRFPMDRLGVVTGTLQWPTNAIPSRFSLASNPTQREPLTDILSPYIELRAYSARSGRAVGSVPQFSNLTEDGSVTRVTFTIIDVPIDVPLVVSGHQKHGGQFGPIYPGAITPSIPVISNCDMGLGSF